MMTRPRCPEINPNINIILVKISNAHQSASVAGVLACPELPHGLRPSTPEALQRILVTTPL